MPLLNEYQEPGLTVACGSGLLEVHRAVLSRHHAKTGFDYPTIHLPHTFSALFGLPTRIFQTVYKGALAFLVVVASASPSSSDDRGRESDAVCAKASVFTRRRSPVRIRPSPLLSARTLLILLHFTLVT